MQLPIQISFRHMEPSIAVEDRIREKAAKLEQFYDRIMGCRVVVEAPHRHRHQGKLYHVRIDLTVPGGELVVSREHHGKKAHEDVYVALRDAFNAAQRQLESYSQRQRGNVKHHEPPPSGRISLLVPEQDYGKIETVDGREIYFHRNSVLNEDFKDLQVGREVRFTEEEGDLGPQASTVHLKG
ncbi:ribosomal subunit interface protein [Nitrosococcus halophilus Nc 4]|uniref:Ribosomal subunit interface protein n=1 Tax=Nitrosococcus halophilus (strain Nc4) TaxID=472759 RepID=D5C5B2_NITHN|nr:HPF/RaiA family ribosome-associated protein [Nitrosococcus halophilus]ADE15335.1 ribosomal subunit interface protein [Nitrosococcus halophilus Nc 4]